MLTLTASSSHCGGLAMMDWPVLPGVPAEANFPWLRTLDGLDKLPFNVNLINGVLYACSLNCTRATNDDSPCIPCQQLQSCVRSLSDLARERKEDIGISTRDFAIDPSQDLIALVQCDDDLCSMNNSSYTGVHIHTISSNFKHPEALSPVIRTLTQSTMTSAFIQIVDDVIGMMFWMEFENPHITIWNWKTGQIWNSPTPVSSTH
ncbi:hypothetical protein F4604DRAFT_1921544 [Suillus subluteus]|nr:hypothetical protein F4604DRAFT_1921544 [Suillus subluteus]